VSSELATGEFGREFALRTRRRIPPIEGIKGFLAALEMTISGKLTGFQTGSRVRHDETKQRTDV